MRAASRSRPAANASAARASWSWADRASRPAIRLSSSAASVERRRRRGTARVVAFCAVFAGLRVRFALAGGAALPLTVRSTGRAAGGSGRATSSLRRTVFRGG